MVVARKPLSGTVAANVLEHGTGALNIDACRVKSDDALVRPPIQRHSNDVLGKGLGVGAQEEPSGRWPTNVVLDETQAAELDEQSGERPAGSSLSGAEPSKPFKDAYGDMAGRGSWTGYGDTGGASRFFPTFRYEAKAPTTERPRHGGIAHPTVKPLELMRWLVRLVTPPGGTVLDPFAGSGTTGEACALEGFRGVLIERESDYLPLIVDRLTRHTDTIAHLRHRAAGGHDIDLGLFEELGGIA